MVFPEKLNRPAQSQNILATPFNILNLSRPEMSSANKSTKFEMPSLTGDEGGRPGRPGSPGRWGLATKYGELKCLSVPVPGLGPAARAVGLTELGGVAGSGRGRRRRQRVRAAEKFHLGTGEAQWWGSRPSRPKTGVALWRGRRPSPRPWWVLIRVAVKCSLGLWVPGMLAM